jgi:hypothetical protein
MTGTVLLIRNSSTATIKVVLEPWVHLFPVEPDKTVELHVDGAVPNEPIEVEYVEGEIIFYAGGIMSVWANGVELDPQFR